MLFFFQAEDGIRDAQESRGLGDVYRDRVNNARNMRKPVAAVKKLCRFSVPCFATMRNTKASAMQTVRENMSVIIIGAIKFHSGNCMYNATTINERNAVIRIPCTK